MKNNNYINIRKEKSETQPDINLIDIIRILFRRKYIVVACIIITVGLAFLYNKIATPIYETSILIKKEKLVNDRAPDEFHQIIQLQTQDEIETEMEILKARTVLEKVVNELGLFLTITQVVSPGDTAFTNEMTLKEYQYQVAKIPGNGLPRLNISELRSNAGIKSGNYYITASKDGSLKLYDATEERLLKSVHVKQLININLSKFELTVEWGWARPGSQIHFRVDNSNIAMQNLKNNITVTVLRKTNLFKLAVKSPSPHTAQLIANKLVDKFRETRFDHKRQTVGYSYDLVDRQLADISADLKKAEVELSDYRRRHNITRIDGSAQENIEFISRLEAEKVETELSLSEYESRYTALRQELKENGYFDQTYLTPGENTMNNSPFSDLLRKLSEAELERLELLQKRTDKHPDIVAVNDRITELKAKLSDFNQNTIDSYGIIIASLQIKREDLKGLIEKYTAKVKNLPQQEMELMDLTRQKTAYEKMFNLLMEKREEMRLASISKLQDIVIVDPAHFPLKPILPRKSFNLAIAFLAGVVLGTIIIFLVELYSRVFANAIQEEERIPLPLPALAVLPTTLKPGMKRLKRRSGKEGYIEILKENQVRFEEAFEDLRKSLSAIPKENNVILFTSCENKSGKSTILNNFAVSMALEGKKILLIDCNFQQPEANKFFHLPESTVGLAEYINSDDPNPPIYQPFEQLIQLTGENIRLDIIPAGQLSDDPGELLDSLKLKFFLQNIPETYDYIFIDTPATTITVDSFILGDVVNHVILVIRPESAYKSELFRTIKTLKEFEAELLGCVVNGDTVKVSSDPTQVVEMNETEDISYKNAKKLILANDFKQAV